LRHQPPSGGKETQTVTTIDLLTETEYAQLRRSSKRTLERERSDGRGCPYVRLGSRIFYRRSDIESYIAEQVRAGDRRAAVDSQPPKALCIVSARPKSANRQTKKQNSRGRPREQ
jgi:hypothetical protein